MYVLIVKINVMEYLYRKSSGISYEDCEDNDGKDSKIKTEA